MSARRLRREPNARAIRDQAFGSVRDALEAVRVQALAIGAPSRFAAFLNATDPEHVIMQLASRRYWIERARSARFLELLSASEQDVRVFIFREGEADVDSQLLHDALERIS